MNRKMVFFSIALIFAASATYIIESSPATRQSVSSSPLLSSGVFQYLYKYWMIEDIGAFVIGAISLVYGIMT